MIRIAPQAGFLLRWLLNSRVGSRPSQVGVCCVQDFAIIFTAKQGWMDGKDKE